MGSVWFENPGAATGERKGPRHCDPGHIAVQLWDFEDEADCSRETATIIGSGGGAWVLPGRTGQARGLFVPGRALPPPLLLRSVLWKPVGLEPVSLEPSLQVHAQLHGDCRARHAWP